MCDKGCSCDKHRKLTTPCAPPRKPPKPGDPDSPWIGIHKVHKTIDIYEEALRILGEEGLIPPSLSEPVLKPFQTQQLQLLPEPIPCHMASSYNYDKDFPPLECLTEGDNSIAARPFVQPYEVLPDG
ncbi:hypothetical protein ACOSP7_022882 [Xanthoceras sorbifolium]